MKVDMELIVDKVREQVSVPANPAAQEAIIDKTQRINRLEAILKQKEEQVDKLKEERDRLVSISSELRSDLNRS